VVEPDDTEDVMVEVRELNASHVVTRMPYPLSWAGSTSGKFRIHVSSSPRAMAYGRNVAKTA
jgi:hypothetical protein